MESFRDQQVSQQLLELVPKYTVGHSPHFDDIVDFFTANAENTHDFLPYFMRKFQVYNEPTLATWAMETPIDSAIICAFSHCLPQEGVVIHPDLPDTVLLARFNFTLSKIFCLDYLDFISRVLRVIADRAFAYELYLWSKVEDTAPLQGGTDLDTWLDRSLVPSFLTGQSLNSVLDGTANVTKRTGLMLEALGEQYREVVMATINLRPQHVVGTYYPSQHVTD
jgi:hypothetical protein